MTRPQSTVEKRNRRAATDAASRAAAEAQANALRLQKQLERARVEEAKARARAWRQAKDNMFAQRVEDARSQLAAAEVMFVAPELFVIARLGEGMPTRSGYGGWENVDRPGATAMTNWQGTAPIELSIPLLVDGWPTRSIEPTLRALERMATIPDNAPRGDQPPVLRVYGKAIPRGPRGDGRWVIVGIEWGEALWHGGRRIRAALTVTLRRYVSPDTVRVTRYRAARARRASGRNTLLIRAGTTLYRAVRDKLRLSGERLDREVKRLKRLNSLRDARKAFSSDRIIKLK